MDFEYENKMKVKIAKETYKRIGKLPVGAGLPRPKQGAETAPLQIATDKNQFAYRNKMEFSFIENNRKISLAFFKRGQRNKIAIDECKLASSTINDKAKTILDWVNKNKLTEKNLKSLIIRSNQKGEVIAGLFIKDKISFNCRDVACYVSTGNIRGFNVYYSTHKSPASVITDVLYKEGQDYLIEEINGTKLKYGINSFFQVNVPVFEMALKDIMKSVGAQRAVPTNIVDFYSGVGSIGLYIAKSVGAIHELPLQMIESNEEAVGFAKENIRLNELNNCIVGARHAVPLSAEEALDYIEKDKTIIFDPPRAGLHQKVIDRILEVKPEKIIYLSCNISTQARDLNLLAKAYKLKAVKLYNFFPRTPHIEALVVLEKN